MELHRLVICCACLSLGYGGRLLQRNAENNQGSEALAMFLNSRGPDAVSRMRGGLSTPAQLITASDSIDTSSASSVAASIGNKQPHVVSSVGGQHHARRLLNALYGTNFDSSLRLGDESSGALLGSSPNTPGCLVLHTEAASSKGKERHARDSCTLNCFALDVADAVLVHSPCVTPTRTLVKEMYEGIFFRHLQKKEVKRGDSRTLLVHVRDPEDVLTASEIQQACMDAWSAATKSTHEQISFADVFALDVVSVPTESKDAQGFAAAVRELKSKLDGASSKLTKGDDFAQAATIAWDKAQNLLVNEASDEFQKDLFFIDKAYSSVNAEVQKKLSSWGSKVAKGEIIYGFGAEVQKTLEDAMHAYLADVAACVTDDGNQLSRQQGQQLVQEIEDDANELFAKQLTSLDSSVMKTFKMRLRKVMGRAGEVKEWQKESLFRKAQKEYHEGISSLLVDGAQIAQLMGRFASKMTDVLAEFMGSSAMKLEALGAMVRKTSRDRKPPRGVRTGLSITAAIHDKFAGGEGNLQSFLGYAKGLNSIHIMYSNDGLIPYAKGDLPPLFRWQPKLNFDISL